MSHFTVLVALPATITREGLDAALASAMGPFDENADVEPYRKYEEGGPEDHWFVSSARRGASKLNEVQEQGVEVVAHRLAEQKPGMAGRAESLSEKINSEIPKWAEDAVWADRLGEHPTWPRVIELLHERYPDGSERLHYDADSDRAYMMSTYNPASRWDYWRIGGRWRGYFPFAGNAGEGDVVKTERDWDSPEEEPAGRCDGGRKRALDLDRLRAEKATEAERDWDDYSATVFGTPYAMPWRVFAERIDQSGNEGYSLDEARHDYRAQPRIQALDSSKKFKYWDSEYETFESHTREEYMSRQAARAVPGYATLDAVFDGAWMAPGKMGWFGMGSEDDVSYADYVAKTNEYVGGLPDDAWLVVLDCHI